MNHFDDDLIFKKKMSGRGELAPSLLKDTHWYHDDLPATLPDDVHSPNLPGHQIELSRRKCHELPERDPGGTPALEGVSSYEPS